MHLGDTGVLWVYTLSIIYRYLIALGSKNFLLDDKYDGD